MNGLSFALLCTLCGSMPAELTADDTVDLVEVNHYYDEQGELVFNQVIFYDWCPASCRYQVRAWRLLKAQSQYPLRDPVTRHYHTIWHDGDVLRRVEAKSYRESWTQYDPELRERDFLPKDQRKGLYQEHIQAKTELDP